MAVTLSHFCAAIQRSLATQLEDERKEQAKLADKRSQQAEQEAAWQEELKRREQEAQDADGSREAARIAQQEQQELERLEFLADVMRRQQAKLSYR